MLTQHIRSFFFQLSKGCAFLCIALISFDLFPLLAQPFLPARPSYFIALLGMFFFFLSGRWWDPLCQHWRLIGLVGLIVTTGALCNWLATRELGPDFVEFSLKSFLKWRVIPLSFLCWFALLFSVMPLEQGKKLFNSALLTFFFMNVAHIILEMQANFGLSEVKAFLVSINPYFRMEKVAHGWWPPPYFETRIRGLFAEPSHLAFASLPLLGLLGARFFRSPLYWGSFLFLVLTFWLGVIRTGLGAIIIFLAIMTFRTTSKRLQKSILLAGGLLILLGTLLVFGGYGSEFIKKTTHSLQVSYELAHFAQAKSRGNDVPTPVINASGHTTFVHRATAFLLDLHSMQDFPLGKGCFIRGLYWTPLEDVNLDKMELGLWVRTAARDKYHGVPHLSEYSSLGAEMGIPTLLLFVLLCFWIFWRGLKQGKRATDNYLYAMSAAFGASLVCLITIPTINGFMFFFFAGFLYAISEQEKNDKSATHCPQI